MCVLESESVGELEHGMKIAIRGTANADQTDENGGARSSPPTGRTTLSNLLNFDAIKSSRKKRVSQRSHKVNLPSLPSLKRAMMLLLFQAVGMHAAPADPRNDAIRAFLQAPPTYCSYQFEKTMHVTVAGKAIPPMMVRGAWAGTQTNWTELLSGDLKGSCGSLSWLSLNGNITVFDEDWNTNRMNWVHRQAKDADNTAQMVLRLGLLAIDFPNAQWDGDQFEADAAVLLETPAERRWQVAGAIRWRSNSEWEISVTNLQTGRLENQAVVRASGAADRGFIPEAIDIFMFIDKYYNFEPKGWVKYELLRILDFSARVAGWSSASFHPLSMPEIHPRSFAFYTNDTEYGFGPFEMKSLYTQDNRINYGAAEKILTMEEAHKQTSRPTYRKPIFLIFAAVMLGASISLFRRRTERTQTTT